jgi:hypothetical protein
MHLKQHRRRRFRPDHVLSAGAGAVGDELHCSHVGSDTTHLTYAAEAHG